MSLLVLAATLARAADPTANAERASWCFPSGLRVLFERTPGRASVSLVSVVDGGSGGEPVAQAGVAHLVEHLWFRTPEMEALEVSTGASVNASTTRDETRFTSTANRRFVRALLGAEVARLRDPLAGVSAEVLATEREIVRNEMRQRFEDNAGRGVLQLFSRLFPEGHPYHHAPIGTHETLDALGLAEARAYTDRWYAPAHTTWYVTGDFPAQTVERLISEALPDELRVGPAANPEGDECGSRATEVVPLPEITAPEVLDHVPAVVAGPVVVFGWSMPPGEHEASMARFDLWLVENDFTAAVERTAACEVYAGALATVGYCALYLEDGDDPEKVLRRGLVEVDKWWDPNAREEVRVAYNRYVEARRKRMVDDLEQLDGTVAERPVEVALHFHRTGGESKVAADLAALATRDTGEEAHFGDAWIRRKRLAAVVLDPAPTDEWPVTLHSLREHPPAPSVDAALVDQARLETFSVEPDLDRLVEKRLPNGLTVHLLPFGSLPVVRAEVLLLAGDEQQDAATSIYAMSALAIAADDRDTWVERGPAWLDYGRTDTDAARAVDRLRGKVEPMSEGLAKPTKALRESVLAYLDRLAELPAVQAGRAREAHLFGIATPSREALELSFAGVTKAGVTAVRDQVLHPTRAHLFVVGGFEPDALWSHVEATWSTWRGAGPAGTVTPPPPAPAPTTRAVQVFDEGDSVMSTVVASCRVDGRGTLAEWQVLEGLLNTALTERLRNTAGATYGIGVRTLYTPRGTVLEARTQVPHQAVGLAVTTILAAWGAAAEGIDPNVIAAEKLAAAKRSALRWQTTWAMLGWMEAAVNQGAPTTAIQGVAERLAAVTPAGLADRLQGCAGAEAVTVVGDAERARASLTEAGIALAAVQAAAP